MSKRFTVVTVALSAVIAFLIGAIFAGGITRSAISAGGPARSVSGRTAPRGAAALNGLVNFADVVERINPAVVNIDATTRVRDRGRRRSRGGLPDVPEPFDGGP